MIFRALKNYNREFILIIFLIQFIPLSRLKKGGVGEEI